MSLGRSAPPGGRPRLWAAAVALSALPIIFGWVLSLLVAPRAYGIVVMTAGDCPGSDLSLDLRTAWPISHLLESPALVVVTAYATWAVTRRRAGAETRTGRVAGWTAFAFLAFRAVYDPLLMALDISQDERCRPLWGPSMGQSLGWNLYWLVPSLALFAALRRAADGRVVPRIAVSTLTAVGLLAALQADAGVSDTIAADAEACERAQPAVPAETESPAQAIARMPLPERELVFLCGVRGHVPGAYGSFEPPGRARRDERTADHLLVLGRAWCEKGGEPGRGDIPDELSPWRGSGGGGLTPLGWAPIAYLCPDVVARLQPALARSRRQDQELQRLAAKRNDEYRARLNAACDPPRRAGPRPYRQATRAVFMGEGGGYTVGGEEATGDPLRALRAAFDDGLVGTDGDLAAVTSTENTPVCVTVRTYRKAPPVALAGWDRVTEVGIGAPRGGIRVSTLEGIPDLPVASVAGAGSYRLRVHVRNQDEAERSTSGMPVEQHLLVVFPGASRKTTVLKGA